MNMEHVIFPEEVWRKKGRKIGEGWYEVEVKRHVAQTATVYVRASNPSLARDFAEGIESSDFSWYNVNGDDDIEFHAPYVAPYDESDLVQHRMEWEDMQEVARDIIEDAGFKYTVELHDNYCAEEHWPGTPVVPTATYRIDAPHELVKEKVRAKWREWMDDRRASGRRPLPHDTGWVWFHGR